MSLCVQAIAVFGTLLVALVAPSQGTQQPRAATHWPQFRGIGARGVADGPSTPTSWDVTTGKGVAWRVKLPGMSHGSPVVWGDRVFVTTAVSEAGREDLRIGLYGDIAPVQDDSVHSWKVYCLDRKTGRILWERTAARGVPKIRRHTKATHANSTCATDGRRVVAFFGSEGLYCYDMAGRLLWKRDLGLLDSGFFMVPSAQWGFASSPILHRDRVIVQCDVQKGGFLAAFRLEDGSEVWRTPRNDVPTWSTPTVVRDGSRDVVVVNGYREIAGYDAATGRRIWHMRGGGDIPVPTPVEHGGRVYITNAHGPMAPIYAIRLTATGDISLKYNETSNAHVAWSHRRNGAYMQTPLVVGGLLYVCRDNGVLGCYDAATGETRYQERLGTGRTGFTASGVSANGILYYTSEEGEVYVVKAGPTYALLGVNSLGEPCLATPAISQGMLLFRTRSGVIALR